MMRERKLFHKQIVFLFSVKVRRLDINTKHQKTHAMQFDRAEDVNHYSQVFRVSDCSGKRDPSGNFKHTVSIFEGHAI